MRSFFDTCPDCGGAIALTDETVDSCCRSYAVLALECADCEAPLLEFDPKEFGGEDGGAVVAFRFTLQAGELPESIAVETADGELDDATVRERFDLPATLQDETVDRGVNEAISALIAEDLQAARDRLSETVPTVCERQTPTATEREPGHSVCCHRYDSTIEAKPRSWDR